jgi:hypothetical protein
MINDDLNKTGQNPSKGAKKALGKGPPDRTAPQSDDTGDDRTVLSEEVGAKDSRKTALYTSPEAAIPGQTLRLPTLTTRKEASPYAQTVTDPSLPQGSGSIPTVPTDSPDAPAYYESLNGNPTSEGLINDLYKRQMEVEQASKVTGWRALAKGLSERMMVMGQNPYTSWQEMLVGLGTAVADPLISRFANKKGYLERYQRPYDVAEDPMMQQLSKRLAPVQANEASMAKKAETQVKIDKQRNENIATAEVGRHNRADEAIRTRQQMIDFWEKQDAGNTRRASVANDAQNAQTNAANAQTRAQEAGTAAVRANFENAKTQAEIKKMYAELGRGVSEDELRAAEAQARDEIQQEMDKGGQGVTKWSKDAYEARVKARAGNIVMRSRREEGEKK